MAASGLSGKIFPCNLGNFNILYNIPNNYYNVAFIHWYIMVTMNHGSMIIFISFHDNDDVYFEPIDLIITGSILIFYYYYYFLFQDVMELDCAIH